MADEISTEEVMENIGADMNESGDVNDLLSFDDVEVDGKPDQLDEIMDEDLEDIDANDESDAADVKLDLKKEESKEEIESKDEESDDEIKLITGTHGKDAVEIKPDTIFKHVIDGKEVEVTQQELLNDFSGRKSWNGKFSELGEEKKAYNIEKQQYTQEKDQLVGQVNAFADAVEKSDAIGALESLANLANVPPVELRKHFISLMEDQAKAYVKLSPEEQKALDNQVEVKYANDRSQHLESQLASQNETANLTNQIQNLQTKYGIDDAKLIELHDELKDKSDNLSIEALEESMSLHTSQGKASDILSKVDPSLSANKGYIQSVSDFMKQNPDLSEEEVLESIKDALVESKPEAKKAKTSSNSEKIQNRISKNANKKKVAKEQVEVLNDDLDDIVDFDEINH